jgi:hypothetical protein
MDAILKQVVDLEARLQFEAADASLICSSAGRRHIQPTSAGEVPRRRQHKAT